MAQDKDANSAFAAFLSATDFPCVGAKSALHAGRIRSFSAGDLRSAAHDVRILAALHHFPHEQVSVRSFVSLAILFPQTSHLSETAFEQHLWERLVSLHHIDAKEYGWDPHVSADPASPEFGMSFGGHGFYVIGMHPGASRAARRTPCATIVFNSHAQFRLLRDAGIFGRMKDAVRKRDLTLQGTLNPMLTDHGKHSEAPQYAGRHVPPDWVCPFKSSNN